MPYFWGEFFSVVVFCTKKGLFWTIKLTAHGLAKDEELKTVS